MRLRPFLVTLLFAPLLAWAQQPVHAADAGAIRQVIEAARAAA